MYLLTNATLYDPDPRGLQSLLVGGERVLWIGAGAPPIPTAALHDTLDLGGAIVIPGLIDGHAHLSGGGGEAGPHTKVPAPTLSQYTTAGVTTAVGVLGTDDVTRSTAELVTAAYALRREGLSAWCHTGGYHLPPTTLTGSVRGDIALVDPIIGVGEVALSDHRSSQPTLDELLRVAAEAHVGGLMSGKAGIVHLHLGDGPRGLALVREALASSELPPRVFNPTHVNRQRALFDEAIALAHTGASIDISAFDMDDDEHGWPAHVALMRYLASGAPRDRVTVSSDSGGCLPVFDAEGRVVRMGVGNASGLLATLRAVVGQGIPLGDALPAFTRNVAQLLRLPGKGALHVGADADLAVLDGAFALRHLMARGQWMLRDGLPVVRGTFE